MAWRRRCLEKIWNQLSSQLIVAAVATSSRLLQRDSAHGMFLWLRLPLVMSRLVEVAQECVVALMSVGPGVQIGRVPQVRGWGISAVEGTPGRAGVQGKLVPKWRESIYGTLSRDEFRKPMLPHSYDLSHFFFLGCIGVGTMLVPEGIWGSARHHLSVLSAVLVSRRRGFVGCSVLRVVVMMRVRTERSRVERFVI